MDKNETSIPERKKINTWRICGFLLFKGLLDFDGF
jgi:hypothetical protein